jgi:hypothetical protein
MSGTERARAEHGRGRLLAISVFGAVTVLHVAGVTLMAVAGPPTLNEALQGMFYVFGVVGFLIALRRPRNAIAWVCLAISLVWGIEAILWGVGLFGLAHPGTVARPEVYTAIGAPLWVPGIFMTVVFPLLLFPDGRLPSPKWRWLPWTVGSSIAVVYIVLVLSEPTTFSYGRPVLDNPLSGVLGPWLERNRLLGALADLLTAVLGVGVVASIIALVLRYRRSSGLERHQLKWLATAGTIAVVLFAIAVPLVDVFGEAIGLVAAGFFVFIPISIGVAVLRYRLYEIDRLISRTVTYGVVVGVLAGVYAVVAIGVPQILPIELASPLFTAAATLTAAAVFNPVRRRVQLWVDRRFNRAGHDAQHEVDRFADRLRTDFALDDVTGEVFAVAAATMEPEWTSMWIRPADEDQER